MANRAAFPPGEAREDWAIIRALSDVIGKKLPYDSLGAVAAGAVQGCPHLMRIDQIEAGKADDVKALAGKGGKRRQGGVQAGNRRFLSDQPDRAGLGGDGGMFAPRLRADADGSGVSVS